MTHEAGKTGAPVGRYIVISDDEWDACMLRFMDPTYGRWVTDETTGEDVWVKYLPMHDIKLAEEGINNIIIAGVAHVAERTFRDSQTH